MGRSDALPGSEHTADAVQAGGLDSLSQPYVPAPIYYEEADRLEYVMRDVPVYYRRLDETLALLIEMDTDAIIGVQIYHPRRAFNDGAGNGTASTTDASQASGTTHNITPTKLGDGDG